MPRSGYDLPWEEPKQFMLPNGNTKGMEVY